MEPKKGRTSRKPVLSDHKRHGAKLVPPYVSLLGRPEDVSWVSTIIPEVIWIAALRHVFGDVVGTELALSLARCAVNRVRPTDHRFFAAASDFDDLTSDEKDSIVAEMRSSRQLAQLRRGFAVLCQYYPTFPIGFLCDEAPPTAEVDLDAFKETLRNLFDKEKRETVLVTSTVVYLAFVLDRLKVVEGLALASFPEVERYPDTELSIRVASAARVAVLGFFGPGRRKSANWPVEFWNRGIELEECVFE